MTDFGFGSSGRVCVIKTNKQASGRLKDLADLEGLEPGFAEFGGVRPPPN